MPYIIDFTAYPKGFFTEPDLKTPVFTVIMYLIMESCHSCLYPGWGQIPLWHAILLSVEIHENMPECWGKLNIMGWILVPSLHFYAALVWIPILVIWHIKSYKIVLSRQWLFLFYLISYHKLHQYVITSNGSWCIGIKGEMSGTVCVTFTWDIYIYIWVVYSFCLFCCLFIIVTWWYIWCIVSQVASKRKYRHVW